MNAGGLIPWLMLSAGVVVRAQDLMPAASPGGTVQLFTEDAASLESAEARKDLPCTVTPTKPSLGFDLKFHAGYEVSVPMQDLAGEGNRLTMVFRVTPDGRPNEAVYFSQHIVVPPIDTEERGPAFLEGLFDVGEGEYHVDWMMRDRSDRICSFHWQADASLPARDKLMALDIAAAAVQPFDTQLFKEEPPIQRKAGRPLHIKVMVNFAPQDAGSSTLRPLDVNALVSILRSIAREPRIGRFSVVAYNMHEQRVIYHERNVSRIDFPALGKALESLKLGTVDLKRLSQKRGETEFLSSLILEEVGQAKDKPDALVFAGPKVPLDDGILPETMKQLGDVKFPVFYMNYNLNPQTNPWRDAIGSAVKYLKGMEFTITRPRDLFFAWTDIIGRIVKFKGGANVLGNAPPQAGVPPQ